MTAPVRKAAAHPPKAAYGSDCNGCGQCCESQLCPLGARAFGFSDGPCPALSYDGEGKSLCGLIAHPQRFFPARALKFGVGSLKQGARILCGAGIGCDACLASEGRQPDVSAALKAKAAAVPRDACERAKRVWGI